ncbi:MAG: phage major capsid protein [Clostridia bacterium]|nr:phage major capsid protein [Clostridia bacterium]
MVHRVRGKGPWLCGPGFHARRIERPRPSPARTCAAARGRSSTILTHHHTQRSFEMNYSAILDRQDQVLDQARALQEKDTFTDGDQTRFDALMAEAKKLGQLASNYRALNGLSDPAEALTVAAQAADIKIVNQPPVYKNLGEQLIDVMAMTTDSPAAPRARERQLQVANAASGGSTGIGSDGGYLVETDKAADIMTTAIETGVLASRCTRQPIGANSDSFSYLAADDRNRSDGKVNGISVYRKGEADTMQDGGKAKLKERELRVEDMYALVYVTNRMLRDARAMTEYIKRNVRSQLAFKLDREIWEGTGAGECLGITRSALPVSVAKESAQVSGTINANNVTKMLARFKGDLTKAAWFINQDCLSQLPLLAIGDRPVYAADFKQNPFGGLLGLPVAPIEFCKTLGQKWDILLGDFSQYLLIQKGGVEEAESIHVKFLTDEMAFRFIVRNNGQPLHDTPITPLNGSNTLSPFVTLDERVG